MRIQTTTHNGREYHLAAVAAGILGITPSTVMRHTRSGMDYIERGSHRYVNIDEARAYIASRERPGKRPLGDVVFGGRLYHPMVWYRRNYGITWRRLAVLPQMRINKRAVYIAEADFMEKYGGKTCLRLLTSSPSTTC